MTGRVGSRNRASSQSELGPFPGNAAAATYASNRAVDKIVGKVEAILAVNMPWGARWCGKVVSW
ncbi:hypothetical protein MAPG_08074 [Magnaporthiopsis poae ATCC 64411]|uniref:Uncharacterized protein n=1 Tax=Magnaporthiopsis poae (strain ATCC 64411 / 73-15) TaxID=644358 RepID=A0A0C4E6E0_MAGP6|nr:hypothetical protein MAPG_08074 [Magnaporthiopsis poae ATCC 64411]